MIPSRAPGGRLFGKPAAKHRHNEQSRRAIFVNLEPFVGQQLTDRRRIEVDRHPRQVARPAAALVLDVHAVDELIERRLRRRRRAHARKIVRQCQALHQPSNANLLVLGETKVARLAGVGGRYVHRHVVDREDIAMARGIGRL
ncbi:MAG: hypothetical protein WDN76_12875 [Alphaproteobacteria bacterium]